MGWEGREDGRRTPRDGQGTRDLQVPGSTSSPVRLPRRRHSSRPGLETDVVATSEFMYGHTSGVRSTGYPRVRLWGLRPHRGETSTRRTPPLQAYVRSDSKVGSVVLRREGGGPKTCDRHELFTIRGSYRRDTGNPGLVSGTGSLYPFLSRRPGEVVGNTGTSPTLCPGATAVGSISVSVEEWVV